MLRSYLDHNATTPLRPEAKQAMVSAMEVTGNPSSVHAEGRAAKAIVEKARAQIAAAMGAGTADIIFVSGATEAAALALSGRGLVGSALEHEAVINWIDPSLNVSDGLVTVKQPDASVLQAANSETGILQDLPKGLAVSDVTQAAGKVPMSYSWSGVEMMFLSAHKFGGPKGVGVLIIPQGHDLVARQTGGGQEMGRRSGTENTVGIAGMGAAIEAADRDLSNGVWDRITELRNILEISIEDRAPDTIFIGREQKRLPNTSCFIAPGWKGETQVMAMDLAGISVSAGSACSSGKVNAGRVLQALGFADAESTCALRVSLGWDTTEEEILRFVETWTKKRTGRRAA